MTESHRNVRITSGQIPMADLDQRGFALAHGGAGPQDPQGDRVRHAVQTLNQLWPENLENDEFIATPSLRKDWPNLNPAARLALRMVHELESEPLFNAGVGASLQADGVARVSASYMDSQQQRLSAIVNAEGIENPSELAWRLQRERFCMVDGRGARQWARREGMKTRDLVTRERFNRWLEHKRTSLRSRLDAGSTGTVGVVTIDKNRNLAAITSTGGVGNEEPGRIGDSPTIAGNFCTKRVAISCTGIGEQIVAHSLSPRVALSIDFGRRLEDAVREALVGAAEREFRFALIAVAHQGDAVVWAAGTTNCDLVWAPAPWINLRRSEQVLS